MAKRKKEEAKLEFNFAKLQRELFKVAPDAELLATMPSLEDNVADFFDTGNYLLNAQISGSLFSGVPSNRVTVLSGLNSTGKTFLALNIARNAQKKGYRIMWIDSEFAIDRNLFKKFNIDNDLIDLYPIGTVEEVITLISKLNSTLKAAVLDNYEIPKILIIIDSLGNLSTKWEQKIASDGEADKADMGHKQKLLRRLFRICTVDCGLLNIGIVATNHVYGTQDKYRPTKMGGGEGPFYNASTIVELSKAQLKEGSTKTKTGIVVTSKMEKSRFTKSGIPIKFHISFYNGMNPYVGLDEYVDYESCGVAPGKLKDGEFIPAESKIMGFAVKHLNKTLKRAELWNSTVFTSEVLDGLDKKLVKIFSLPANSTLNFDEIESAYDDEDYNSEVFDD